MEHYFGKTRIDVGKEQAFEDLLPAVIRHYANALHYGVKHIYQVMPRMLTLWLDHGRDAVQAQQDRDRAAEKDPELYRTRVKG